MRILLTGATGYVGSKLLGALQASQHDVRCLVRNPDRLTDRLPGTQVVTGDVVRSEGLAEALEGIETAFYLIHALGSGSGFEEAEKIGATNFARAASRAGVRRIIYLGGLAQEREDLSAHMRSRIQVGEALRESGAQVVEFRASIIIGAGSLSFEMIRALVERLPVMVTPRWVRLEAQPIAIEDVLAYLIAAVDMPLEGHKVFEIGGSDRASYGQIMREYARARGLPRFMIPVPVLTPRLSGLWLALVTPVHARVGRKLINSIRYPSVVISPEAKENFDISPIGISEAITTVLQSEDRAYGEGMVSETRRRDQSPVARFVDSRTVEVAISPQRAFGPIRRLGGDRGWFAHDWLWRLRGAIDLLAGGVGMRRGRRDAERLRVGDKIDSWRVESIVEDRRLRLAAEMKLPGRAWLDFEVVEAGAGSRVRQTAIFDPSGVTGRLYWHILRPVHEIVFSGMLDGYTRAVQAPEDKP